MLRVTPEEALRRGWIADESGRVKLAKKSAGSPKQPTVNAAAKPSAKPAKVEALSKVAGRPRGKREIEGEEQAELIKLFRARFEIEGELLIHVPNGGSRKNKFEGWRLKEQGTRAGVSDLLLPVARGGYHGLWIEFKATPPNDSTPTEQQLEWLELMRAQGFRAELCLGLAAAFAVLLDYMSMPPTELKA